MDWGSSFSTFTSKAAKLAKDAAQEANKAVVVAAKAQVGKKLDLHVDYIWHEGQALEFEMKGLTVSASKCATVFSGDVVESINDVPVDKDNIRTLLEDPKPLHFRLRHLTPQEMGEINEKFLSRMGLAKNKITSLEAENKELKMLVQPGAVPGVANDENSETRSSELATSKATLAAAHEEAEQLRAQIAQLQAGSSTADSSAAQLTAMLAEIAETREKWTIALGEIETLKAQLANRDSAAAEAEALKQQLFEVQGRQGGDPITESESAELKTQVTALKSELSITQMAQDELAALKIEHNRQDERLTAMQQQVASANGELAVVQKEAAVLKQQLAASQEGQEAESLAAAREQIDSLNMQLATAETMREELAAAKQDLVALKAKHGVQDESLSSLQQQIASGKVELSAAQQEADALKQQLAMRQEEQDEGLTAALAQIDALNSQLASVETTREELSAAQQELVVLKTERSGEAKSLEAVHQQIASSNSDLLAAHQEADRLKQQLAAVQETQDEGTAAAHAEVAELRAKLIASQSAGEELAASQLELTTLKTTHAELNEVSVAAQREVEVLKHQLAAVQEEQEEGAVAAQAEVAELRAKLVAAHGGHESLASAQTQIDALNAQLAAAQTTQEELATAQQELATLKAERLGEDDNLASMHQQVVSANIGLAAAQQETDVLKQRLVLAQEEQDESLTAAQEEAAELKKKLATAQAAHESLASALTQIDELNAQLIIAQTAQEELVTAQQELATLKTAHNGQNDSLVVMQEQFVSASSDLEMVQREAEALKHQLVAVREEQNEDLAASQAEAQELKQHLALAEEAETILTAKQSEIESLKQQLLAEHERHTGALTSAQSQIESLKQQLATAHISQGDLATAREEVETIQISLTASQQAFEELKLEGESTSKLPHGVDGATTELNALRAELEAANISLTAAQQEVAILQTQLGSTGGHTASLEKELAEKTEALSAAQNEVVMLKHTLSISAENEMPPELKVPNKEAQIAEELQAGLDLAMQEVVALQTAVDKKEASLVAAQEQVAALQAQIMNAAGQPTTAEVDRLKSELVERNEALAAARRGVMSFKHTANAEAPFELETLRKEAHLTEELQASLDLARQEVDALNAQLDAQKANLVTANEEIAALREQIDTDVLSLTVGDEESKSQSGKKTVLSNMFRRLAPKIPLSPAGRASDANVNEQLASALAEIALLKEQLRDALGEIDIDVLSPGDDEGEANKTSPGVCARSIGARAERKTLKDRFADARNDIASLKEELAQLRGDPAAAHAPTRAELQVRYEASLEQAKLAHDEEIKVQREQLQDAYEKIVRLTDAQAHGSEEELDAVRAELEGLKGNQAAFEAARAAAEKQAEAFEADLNAANAARRQLQEKQAEIETLVEQLRGQLEEVTTKKDTIKTRAKEMKVSFEQRINEMSQEKEALEKEKDTLLKDLETSSPERVLELEALLVQKDLDHAELMEKTRQEIASMKKENSTMQQVSQWEVNNAQNDLKQMRADLEESRRQLAEAEDVLKVEREHASATLKTHAADEVAQAKIEADVQALQAENAVNAAQLRRIREEHLQCQGIATALTQERDSLQVALKEQKHQQELLHSESQGQIGRLLSQIAALQKDYSAAKVESERAAEKSIELSMQVSDVEERRQSAITQNSEMRTRLTQYQQMSDSDALKRAIELEDQVASLSASLSDEQVAHANSRAALARQLDDLRKQLDAALAIKEGVESETDENSDDELFDFLQDSALPPIDGNARGTGGAVYGRVRTAEDVDLEEGCATGKGGLTNRALVKKVAKLQEKLNKRPIVCHFSDAPRSDVPLFFKNLPLVKAAERPLIRLTATMNRSKSCMWIFFVHLAILYLYILFRRPACVVPRIM